MATPHKHADVIKAWADGAQVQWRRDESHAWEDAPHPAWAFCNQYRVKPNTVRFRLYAHKYPEAAPILTLFTYRDDPCVDAARIRHIESNHGFVRWIGDVQEVEV